MKFYLKEAGIILLGAFILCVPVFYNGYPFLTYDSGTYIRSGFTGAVPIDRPLAYGLFSKYASMSFSLWFTIYTQCILLSGVLYLFLKNSISRKEKFNFIYLVILIALTFFTNAGWCAGQIMADIFAPLLIISFISLLLIEKLTLLNLVFLAFVFILSCATHLTHLLMAMTASGALLFFLLVFKKRKITLLFSLKRVLLVSLLAIVSLFTVLTINYTHKDGGGFKLSRGTHVFLMAHFIETGIMEEFLKENCDKPEFKDCKTCLYKDSLEHSLDQYLWWWNGTLYKTGGWEGTEKEHKFILKSMFSDLNFTVKNIYGSFRFGLTELCLTKVGDGIGPLGKDTPPWIEINKYYHDELNAFLSAKQSTAPFLDRKLDRVNDYNTFLLITSICSMLYYFIYKKNKNKEYFYGLLIIIFVIINAFLTAGLNAPCPRFQSRVVWIIPLFFMILLINNRMHILNYCKRIIANVDKK